ncbi:TetR/AcrR family transcriptional regulator [Aquirufa sp. Wall-65K1]
MKIYQRKGERSRENIILVASEVLNTYGSAITIDEIARYTEISKSKITNHFSTKEALFIAIADLYIHELQQYFDTIQFSDFFNWKEYIGMLSDIMDIQFKYRNSIICIWTASFKDENFMVELKESFKLRKKRMIWLFEKLVKEGYLHDSVFEEKNFEIFYHQHAILGVHWLNTYLLFDFQKSYQEVKPTYLAGTIEIYKPYLTAKGLSEFEALDLKSFLSERKS